MTIIHLKQDDFLFSRALTASQERQVSVSEILMFKNRSFQPSFATPEGKMRKTTKSDILDILVRMLDYYRIRYNQQ